MLCIGNDFEVENYSAYRNRTVNKHVDKIKNQFRQIKSCSLKPEDKKRLFTQLIEIANDELKK